MLAVNYTSLRKNMKSYFDKVVNEYETMVVTRKNNENVVVLSEDTYNNRKRQIKQWIPIHQ